MAQYTGCWVSGLSQAKHGSVCYLLIIAWHEIKCSAEGRPKCQHLTGQSPPASMSWPWCSAWHTILLGNIYKFCLVVFFFLIKQSSSWLQVNEIFTKKTPKTSYTGCVNLSHYKNILPLCTINIQLWKAIQRATISTENYTVRQDSLKMVILKVGVSIFFFQRYQVSFRCSDEMSIKPVFFHGIQKSCTCP